MTFYKVFQFANHLNTAVTTSDGESAARLFSLRDAHAKPLFAGLSPVWQDQLNGVMISKKNTAWREMALSHVEVLIQRSLQDPSCSPVGAYEVQAKLVSAFLRWLSSTQSNRWSLPVLYAICADLRELAIKADLYLVDMGQKPTRLSDCASRHLMKGFSSCISDRGGVLDTSRRWGTYAMANLLFKTYFKLKALALCKNIKRAIDSSADLPPLSIFPMNEQCSFRYHTGVFAFLNESYESAEQDLMFAFAHCPAKFSSNRGLILAYLIPLRMSKGILPSAILLKQYPNLKTVYEPLTKAMMVGDIEAFDKVLGWAEQVLLTRGTYLAVEAAREICLRRLAKKIWLTQQMIGAVPNVRLDLSIFQSGFKFANIEAESDEVECILANMIYKNHIKGYLSHTQQKLVLSQKQPFPPIVQPAAVVPSAV